MQGMHFERCEGSQQTTVRMSDLDYASLQHGPFRQNVS